MANYKEITGTGTSWRRAKKVIIDNPAHSSLPKTALFIEEDAVSINEKIISTDAGSVTAYFNPQDGIELRDPQTGEKTGVIVGQTYLYQLLYSLYMQTAENRDNYKPIDIGSSEN